MEIEKIMKKFLAVVCLAGLSIPAFAASYKEKLDDRLDTDDVDKRPDT